MNAVAFHESTSLTSKISRRRDTRTVVALPAIRVNKWGVPVEAAPPAGHDLLLPPCSFGFGFGNGR